jgi:hypothetical protein
LVDSSVPGKKGGPLGTAGRHLHPLAPCLGFDVGELGEPVRARDPVKQVRTKLL